MKKRIVKHPKQEKGRARTEVGSQGSVSRKLWL